MSATVPKVETVEAIVVCSDLASLPANTPGLTPEQLVGLLTRYRELVQRAIEDSGGEINAYIGDATIAVWPAPQTDHDKMKIGAGVVTLLEAVSCFRLPGDLKCKPRIGVAAGKVIRADMAINGRPYPTELLGSTINLAKRLNAGCVQFKADILFLEDLPLLWPQGFKPAKVSTLNIVAQSEAHTLFTLQRMN